LSAIILSTDNPSHLLRESRQNLQEYGQPRLKMVLAKSWLDQFVGRRRKIIEVL
jgi:hypothetical protein